jgi:polysaccharide biosynthesis/export protein
MTNLAKLFALKPVRKFIFPLSGCNFDFLTGRKTRVLFWIVLLIVPLSPYATAMTMRQQRESSGSSDRQSQAARNPMPKALDKSDKRDSASILLDSEEEYRLGPNDLIDIQIEKAEELSGSYRITASGSFTMQFLGQVLAQGKTSEELAAQIANGLRDRYLVNPNVRVAVLQYSGQSFFIQGAVRVPGKYQIKGRPTLLELITIAGGLTDTYGSTAFLIRKIRKPQILKTASLPKADEPSAQASADEGEIAKFELVKANINGLLRGNFDNNIVIEPGDIIHIPPVDVFFVAGEVNVPGSFPLKDGTTLSQAISLAQGTTTKAATNHCIIRREDPSGKRQEIIVDVGAVMKGKQEDVLLMANDIIVIPNSRAKSLGDIVMKVFGGTAARVIRY